ncbi:MAG TPA: hypothetical protein ENI05_03995 [Porticoccus sp.]|nr:hypothetical protein [Porticoccus sp.]
MPETIVLKKCSSCKEIKPLTEFYKNCCRKDGYRCYCKDCHTKINQQYWKTKKGKLCKQKATKKFRQTEKGKLIQQKASSKYLKTEKGRQNHKEYCNKNPEKRKAKNAIASAIRSNKLVRPDTLSCSCGEQAMEYHHHKGYDLKHWLNVVAVCHKCHCSIHYQRPTMLG